MPKIASTLQSSGRSNPARPQRKRPYHRPAVVAPSTHLSLLGPACSLAVPTLAGIPAAYEYFDNDSRIFALLRRMAEAGIATATTPAHIENLRSSPLNFAKASLSDWLDREGGKAIENLIDYCVCIDSGYSEESETAQRRGDLKSPLVITIFCGMCGYLALRKVLAILEARERHLARAFYNAVAYGCCRWMRIYDFDAARYYVEGEKERMEEEKQFQEDPEEASEWEIPDVEKEIPEYLRKGKKVPVSQKDIALLRRFENDRKVGSWIRHALEIHRLGQMPIERDCRARVSEYYDSAPVPTLLIAMTPYDNIEGCFDMEAECMNQSSPEPNFAVDFDPENRGETTAAFNSLRTFIHLNRELCQLTTEVSPLFEKERAN